jgi:hypothetical protein
MADGLDFKKEIAVAQFWRKHIGEMEYVKQNPDDLRRWYDAMELRGPEDIRSYLAERDTRHPMPVVTGIVATAPHPSREIVQVWLESHTKVRTGQFWLAGAGFVAFSYFVASNLLGCVNIRTVTPLQANPPSIGGQLPGHTALLPTAPATLPQPLAAPASVASPPTGQLRANQGAQ